MKIKLTAKTVPYSSVVGSGIMLLDEKGAAVGQLAIIGNVTVAETPIKSREQMEELARGVAKAINKFGLEIGV